MRPYHYRQPASNNTGGGYAIWKCIHVKQYTDVDRMPEDTPQNAVLVNNYNFHNTLPDNRKNQVFHHCKEFVLFQGSSHKKSTKNSQHYVSNI